MGYISALRTFVENQKEQVKELKVPMETEYKDTNVITIFIEDNKLWYAMENPSFFTQAELTDDVYAESLYNHITKTEGIFIPYDE